MSIRVLHITDLHIVPEIGRELYGGDTFESLSRVLQRAFSLVPNPNCVLITGDLVEQATPTSYTRLRSLLLEIDVPVYVLPGNHDSVYLMREWLCGDHINSPTYVQLGVWGLLSLNSQVEGKSHGEISTSSRDEIVRVLSAEPKRSFLVGLHHTPIPACPSHGCQLSGAQAFLDLLAAFPSVRAVTSGHAHLAAQGAYCEIALFTTPSTCAQAWHAQNGDIADHDDFWASHRFDATRQGFRLFDLKPDGSFESTLHWL